MKVATAAFLLVSVSIGFAQTSDGSNNSDAERRAAQEMSDREGGSWVCTQFTHPPANNGIGNTTTMVCAREDGFKSPKAKK